MYDWRTHLPDLVASGSFRTQGEIVRALATRGAEVDQATVSRQLASIGASKVDGVYRLPAAPEIGAPLHSFTTTAGGSLAVLKTDPAFAAVLGQFVDGAGLAGVLGTVAGDDTVFVALSGPRAARELARVLGMPAQEAGSRRGS